MIGNFHGSIGRLSNGIQKSKKSDGNQLFLLRIDALFIKLTIWKM
jgi:hypothetical protein